MSKFSEAELSQLRKRTDEVAGLFEEGHKDRFLSLNHHGRDNFRITFTFDCESVPKVTGVGVYLAVNYDVAPAMPPGSVRVDTIEEAYAFLDLVEARAQDPHPIDYERILGAAGHLYQSAIASQVAGYTDEYTTELPSESDGMSEWLGGITGLEGAEVITVVADLPHHGSFCGVEAPKDDVASLMVLAYHDRGEVHEELAWYMESAGIPEDSLEELLFEQLFCISYDCAAIEYALAATVWLLPVPENLEYLEYALDGENFKDYYDDVPERRYVAGHEEDGRYYPGTFVADEISHREEAVSAWLDAVKDEIDQVRWHDDRNEYMEEWLRLNDVLPTLTVKR